MLLAAIALAVAVGLGYATGGDLRRLGRLPLRRTGLVWSAGAVQLAGSLLGGPAYQAGLAGSAALVAVFLHRNRGLRGTGLLALGLLANALVVGVNGAMPVSLAAAGRAGVSTQDILTGADARHVVAGPGTHLRWLGDVVPVPWPVHPEAASPGDVLLSAGLAQLVVVGMRRGAAGRHARGAARRLPAVPGWRPYDRVSPVPTSQED